ncbi:tyrosine-type recombinase/integrase [Crossiella sp. CA-258035]|uniref:site-specific integrase n=1 Tax=Crossiella sp. CA-258035 TaxID=2981138 RepID=UPI0024BCC1F4|nr:site-specific integrase [Crossiella sp. CA-258035]WHT20943.1 tyrosine-type recombinase/integrase [Crossiella sp. CA-258035]
MGRTGRPPLPVGTFGEIWVTRKNGRPLAECYYRDYDGVTRRAKRYGDSPTKAKIALKKALAERRFGESPDDMNAETKFSVVCEKWWEEFEADSTKSPTTKRLYEDRMNNQIIPALGELRVREVTLGRIGKMIKSVTKENGTSTAKATRSVLSKILGFAGRHNAVNRNPTKDLERIEQGRKTGSRSLELSEAIELRKQIHGDKKSKARDLPDFSDMMLATGMRIGEASAVVWDAIDWTPGAEAVEIRGTVIREKGVGLYIKWEPKTPAGYRTLDLPSWTVAMLKARRTRLARVDLTLVAPDAPVFTAPKGGLRDPSNTQADLREAFDLPDEKGVATTEWTWVTSHVWRKTVATLMDEAGKTAREAADQLGHAKVSTTQDHYFGRKKRVSGGAEVMEAVEGA